jgi:ATP-dependent DNA ligase
MRLAVLREAFDHPDWVFELKYDGFRSLAVWDGTTTKLVSRKHHVYKFFKALAAEIAAALRGRRAIRGSSSAGSHSVYLLNSSLLRFHRSME